MEPVRIDKKYLVLGILILFFGAYLFSKNMNGFSGGLDVYDENAPKKAVLKYLDPGDEIRGYEFIIMKSYQQTDCAELIFDRAGNDTFSTYICPKEVPEAQREVVNDLMKYAKEGRQFNYETILREEPLRFISELITTIEPRD